MSLVDLGKRLLETAKRGESEEVRSLMSNGAPFTTDWLGTSPLHFASQYGHVTTAEILLRAGISRDARTKVDRTPLHVAAQEGHLDLVDLLLRNGADVDAKDMLKMSPLHWAVEKGHFEVISMLLKNGADINAINKFDKSPLDIAINNGRADLVQVMQCASINPSALGVELSESEPSKIEEVTTSEVPIETTEDEHVVIASPVAMVPEMDNETQNSTSVLATLAALAEATAPNGTNQASTTDTETLNWLEKHGISMISSGEHPTLVSSALESGQILALTEGGNLALNSVKKQTLKEEDEEDEEDLLEEETITVEEAIIEEGTETLVEEDSDSQHVITIVSAESGSTEEILTVNTESDDDDEPATKRSRKSGSRHVVTSGGETVVISNVSNLNNQQDLRRQLEAVQKQAQKFKEQLERKEQEAAQYKKTT